MQPFCRIHGLVVPLDRSNVDTDAIIPKQYLKSIYRTGYGPNLFDDWRYLDPGEPFMDHGNRHPDPDFVLNLPRYHNSEILLARENFGCGSSREHAVWAMVDYGIRVVIAPGFADIFFGNTLNNGLLAVTLEPSIVDRLFAEVAQLPGYRLTVDLESQTIATPGGEVIDFAIEAYRRHRLLHGLDDIAMTLLRADEIRAFERHRRKLAPWLWPVQPALFPHETVLPARE